MDIGVGTADVASSVPGQQRDVTEQRRRVGTGWGAVGGGVCCDVVSTTDFGAVGQAVTGEFSQGELESLRQNPRVRHVEGNGGVPAYGV